MRLARSGRCFASLPFTRGSQVRAAGSRHAQRKGHGPSECSCRRLGGLVSAPSPNSPCLVPRSLLLNIFSSTGLKPVTFAGWGLVKMPGHLGRVTTTFQGSGICEAWDKERKYVCGGARGNPNSNIWAHEFIYTKSLTKVQQLSFAAHSPYHLY